MKTIFYIIQKEFIQVSRNRMMLPIIFVVPIVQLLILVHAATFEMKQIKMCVVDNDFSATSRKLISKFSGSPFFRIKYSSFSYSEAEKFLQKGKADVILQIPPHFEKNLNTNNPGKVMLSINAINGVAAGLIYAYSGQIINDFNKDMSSGKIQIAENHTRPETINITYTHWYNPQLNYKTFMVPGILVLLVTLIGLFLAGMNIVREKEIGTIEQINVTPIKKYQFIAGKLVPFWIIALFELAFGLSLGKLLFNIPMLGSLWLVFLAAAIYLIAVLGMGLFISTLANTQQQAMFLSFFFMIVFLLMSGLFTSVESMPQWAQYFNKINPIAYFIRIMRMVLLKGSGFSDIRIELLSLAAIGSAVLAMAVRRYRKVA